MPLKELNFFDPIDELGRDESERHYLAVHVPFARRLFRAAPAVHRYSPHAIVAQRDLGGQFRQRPDLWRLVLMQFEGEDYLAASVGERVMLDHWNCLQEIRSYRVRETLLADLLAGQTACAKFLVAIPRGSDPTADAGARADLAKRFERAFGARQLVHDEVEFLRGTEDRGRRLTAELIADPPLAAFVELAFDSADWGEEFLADPEVADLLGLDTPGGSKAYLVREEPGVDRRANR